VGRNPFGLLVAQEGQLRGIGVEEVEAVFSVLAFGREDELVTRDEEKGIAARRSAM
jgi:hypothetical protein